MKKRILIAFSVFAISAALILIFIPDPQLSRASIISILALIFWLTELVPFPATTLLLCSAIPLCLGPLNAQFNLSSVLLWVANPVLPLFFGGFVMGVAMCRHGLDSYLANSMLRFSGGKAVTLIMVVIFGTAFLSMWMSNIAAAAMMIAALRPFWNKEASDVSIRIPLLLSVAFGANFGGMATPIGSGPNAIAIAAVQFHQRITFLEWMSFGIPLTIGMLILAFVLIRLIHPIPIRTLAVPVDTAPMNRNAKIVAALFGAAALLWLLEPFHGIPAPVIAILFSAVLFATRILKTSDLAAVDWQTLFLIAGGLVLGELVNRSGITQELTQSIVWNLVPRMLMVFLFVFAAAFLSAIASNTAAAALLIPFALSMNLSPAVAILIAMGASMGAPFVISTPPNAMAYGEGGLQPRHFLVPGLILMIFGCAVVSLTGEKILAAIGIR